MKKLIVALISLMLLTSCSVTYYSYCEVESPDDATWVSKQDGIWNRTRKSPSRCVAVYPDSTGKRVYLMETKVTEPIKNEIDYD